MLARVGRRCATVLRAIAARTTSPTTAATAAWASVLAGRCATFGRRAFHDAHRPRVAPLAWLALPEHRLATGREHRLERLDAVVRRLEEQVAHHRLGALELRDQRVGELPVGHDAAGRRLGAIAHGTAKHAGATLDGTEEVRQLLTLAAACATLATGPAGGATRPPAMRLATMWLAALGAIRLALVLRAARIGLGLGQRHLDCGAARRRAVDRFGAGWFPQRTPTGAARHGRRKMFGHAEANNPTDDAWTARDRRSAARTTRAPATAEAPLATASRPSRRSYALFRSTCLVLREIPYGAWQRV